MIEVSAEDGISSGQVFLLFCFFFAVVFIVMAIQEKNLNKRLEDIKTAHASFSGYIKVGNF